MLSVALADVVHHDHRMIDDIERTLARVVACSIDRRGHGATACADAAAVFSLSVLARSATLRNVRAQSLQRRRRQLPGRAAGVVPLDVVLDDRQDRREHEVPHGGDHQQRPHRAVAVVDDPHLVEQLADRHHVDDRRALEQVDDLVGARRQDRAHRLRQHDPPELAESGDAERSGGFALAEVDRQQAGAHDFRRVRRLVHGESDDRRGHRAEQVERLSRTEARPERDADRQRRVQVGEVVPEQQVDDQRDRAEQPRVGPADRLQQRALRQPHRGEHGAEAEADARCPRASARGWSAAPSGSTVR